MIEGTDYYFNRNGEVRTYVYSCICIYLDIMRHNYVTDQELAIQWGPDIAPTSHIAIVIER